MGVRRIGAIALSSLAAVSAFHDTSPLILFSTSKQLDGIASSSFPQLATSSRVHSHLEDALSKCTARSYVIVSQPGVQTADYAGSEAMPHLTRYVSKKEKHIASSTMVPDVVGGVDADALSAYLEKQCGASVMPVNAAEGYIALADKFPRVIKVDFTKPAKYPEERAATLLENDSFLNIVLSSIHDANYTVIYTTTPASREESPELTQQEHAYGQYEMDDGLSPLHVELKRDIETHATNTTYDLPLFEKYMFFSPALFMGFVAIIPLIVLVYVGVSAVSGLEVSYFAFSKEMGPTAQKKQG